MLALVFVAPPDARCEPGADTAAIAAAAAADYLELVAEPDGRCQILSEGGQLEVLYNRHPDQAVEYRLLRVFAGDHPQGLVTGIALPGADGIKLGCTRVDGRIQAWRIQRARFAK